jgi:uncharacterized membrane protein YccC
VAEAAVEQEELRRESPPMIGPADHPVAASLIKRAKGWGGMGGFLLTAAASSMHGSPLFETCVRGLLGGIAGYLIAWSVAVSIGRSLLKAQGQLAIERVLESRRRQIEEATQAARKAAEEMGVVIPDIE